MFALFNKNKQFIGYSSDIPESSNLLKKEIPENQSDLSIWRWEGDYDGGKMVSIDIGYPIEEIELEKQLFEYIHKKYPTNIQFFNIIKQLKKIIDNNEDIQNDEFMDMADAIISAMDKHNKRINYYSNYAKLIPKHESEKQFKNAFGNQ